MLSLSLNKITPNWRNAVFILSPRAVCHFYPVSPNFCYCQDILGLWRTFLERSSIQQWSPSPTAPPGQRLWEEWKSSRAPWISSCPHNNDSRPVTDASTGKCPSPDTTRLTQINQQDSLPMTTTHLQIDAQMTKPCYPSQSSPHSASVHVSSYKTNHVYLACSSLWLRESYFELWLLKEDLLVKGEAFKLRPHLPTHRRFHTKQNHISFCIVENVPVQWAWTRSGLAALRQTENLWEKSRLCSIRALDQTSSQELHPLWTDLFAFFEITLKIWCPK